MTPDAPDLPTRWPGTRPAEDQLTELRLADGTALRFGVFQDDDEFALWPECLAPDERRLEPDWNPSNTLFRNEAYARVPFGRNRRSRS